MAPRKPVDSQLPSLAAFETLSHFQRRKRGKGEIPLNVAFEVEWPSEDFVVLETLESIPFKGMVTQDEGSRGLLLGHF